MADHVLRQPLFADRPASQDRLRQARDAFGAVGYRASNIAELREALRKAQQSDGPVLIDCQIDKDERVLPMIPAGGTIDDLVVD